MLYTLLRASGMKMHIMDNSKVKEIGEWIEQNKNSYYIRDLTKEELFKQLDETEIKHFNILVHSGYLKDQ